MATNLRYQFVGEPLAAQRIGGTCSLVIWGQNREKPGQLPASWAVTARIVSGDGDTERGVLLPFTRGERTPGGPDAFQGHMAPVSVGPLPLSEVEVKAGDRAVIEIGSDGEADVEAFDGGRSWFEFSEDIVFLTSD
jgi:hypothetical protein